jgi:DNA mismatch repair protein MutL
MSDVIKLLPEHVANQIAAGEVIQRPASVVKELLDNAIDAGSSQIKIIIRDGGKTLIQVIDNGLGMSPTDARMCWERHATSKISSAEDIFQIKTMGFRGEALASIGSVAMVEMKTKREIDKLGTAIIIEGTQVISQLPAALPSGTSITVKNLFYNIPARRNFLKSDAVEMRHIIDEFTRTAIVHPETEMSLFHNDNEVYRLPSHSAAERLEAMFGYKLDKQLLELQEQTTIVNLTGFIGKPEFAKRTRGEQFIFVNNRYIKDAYLNHAVVSCYENLITKEQFPFYVLFIEIAPGEIDVNVHPTKTEIKFEDERSVYHIVKAVCKRALGTHFHIPQYTPESPDQFLNLSGNSERGSSYQTTSRWEHADRQTFSKQHEQKDWQELFSVINKKETIGDLSKLRNQSTTIQPVESVISDEQTSRNMIQIHGSVIISQIKSGVLLIDQQSAHERILYEKYLQAIKDHPIASQQVLFPKTITLNAQDEQLLKDMIPHIRKLGFDVNELGKNTFVLNGLPAELQYQNEQELIEDMLDGVKKSASNEALINDRIARTLARRASVKSGTKLNEEEITSLIDALFACETPYLSPDGKPCLTKLSLEDLFKLIR